MTTRPSVNRTFLRIEALATKLEALASGDVAAATALAIDVVGRERAHRVLEPALEILVEAPRDDARAALRDRFIDLTENGTRYDQDCSLRVAIIRALRAIGSHDDADIAERGLRTIQLNPPARIDVAQALRAESLLFLAEIEPDRADYFAVELLVDPHASTFSGEPPTTAIRVLAKRGHILPIWTLARRPGSPPDVLAQAFASLRKAPADLQTDALLGHLNDALDRGEEGEAAALVAAEAIVLNRLVDAYQAVINLLATTSNHNLYRYLVLAATRSGDDALRDTMRRYRDDEKDPRKRDVLAEIIGRDTPERRSGQAF